MQRDGEQRFSYTLSGVLSDYRYKISGGGTWTSEYPIRMVPRPIIDAVTASIRLPGYMQREELLPVADDVRRIEAPIDSHLVLSAAVSGDVAEGEIVLLQRDGRRRMRKCTRRSMSGSRTICRPTPTPNRPGAGAPRGCSPGSSRSPLIMPDQPFGFSTRLTPLHVPEEGVFYLMVWLDAADPPGRLILKLQDDKLVKGVDYHTTAFEWGEKSPAAPKSEPPLHLGPLPEPMHWTRLEVPADALGSNPVGAEIARHVADRRSGPGLLRSAGLSDPQVAAGRHGANGNGDHAADAAATKRRAAGSGEVPVADNTLLTVRFHSSLRAGQRRSRAAGIDRRPKISRRRSWWKSQAWTSCFPRCSRCRSRPGAGRLGDRGGRHSNRSVGKARWRCRVGRQSDGSLTTSRSVSMSIDPEAEHLAPGQSLCYRLVAKDCDKQIGESKTFKLSIAAPDKVNAPETAKPPDSLDPLMQFVAQMAQHAAQGA